MQANMQLAVSFHINQELLRYGMRVMKGKIGGVTRQ